mgnify:CR=1 FL=1
MLNFLQKTKLESQNMPAGKSIGVIGSLRAKLLNSLSGFSAFLATIGSSWSLCHSICLALITVLAGIGVVITGMPLLFLFEYNLYLWGAAVFLLIPSSIMFFKNPKCISKNLLLFNFGVIIAGIPANLVNLQPFSWLVGGILILAAISLFIRSKVKRKTEGKNER